METQRNYRDRLYCMIFAKDRSSLLSLYNTINGTDYTNPDELEINTLENAIYMNMKNDISFVLDCSLNLYEQQSTFCPNMPLRNLFYVSKLLQGMTVGKNIYGTVPIRIPMPRFVVFYNGTEKLPERQVLRLSDAFEKVPDVPDLELIVTMLNINPGYNAALMEGCKTLKEYMLYVDKVRKYAKTMPTREAVTRAVDECIREGILAEFLTRYRAEAIEVSIFEYDEATHMLQEREQSREEGRTEGEWIKLISQIQKKLSKNMDIEQIADMLEEEQKTIQELVALIAENPGKSKEELAEIYLK